jgi:hypothetical protein
VKRRQDSYLGSSLFLQPTVQCLCLFLQLRGTDIVRSCLSLFFQIPILCFLSGYFFHLVYQVTRADGAPMMRMTQQPALFEGKFLVEKLGTLTEIEEQRVLLSLMMAILLERSRG